MQGAYLSLEYIKECWHPLYGWSLDMQQRPEVIVTRHVQCGGSDWLLKSYIRAIPSCLRQVLQHFFLKSFIDIGLTFLESLCKICLSVNKLTNSNKSSLWHFQSEIIIIIILNIHVDK